MVARLLAAFRTNSAEFERKIGAAHLSAALLPALEGFDTEIDLRVRFSKDSTSLTVAAPVLLFYIQTDVREHRLWFQMNLKQTKAMLRALEKEVARLETAERFANQILAQSADE